jgi:hypothetical protein
VSWAKRYGDAQTRVIPGGLAVTATDRALVAGQLVGMIDFGAGSLMGEFGDGFVARFYGR